MGGKKMGSKSGRAPGSGDEDSSGSSIGLSQQRPKIKTSGEELEEKKDDAHVSRLFYLQLYSSVLKAEKDAKESKDTLKSKEKKKTLGKTISFPKSLSWMDVGSLLHKQLSSTESNAQLEREIGDSYQQDSHVATADTLAISSVSASDRPAPAPPTTQAGATMQRASVPSLSPRGSSSNSSRLSVSSPTGQPLDARESYRTLRVRRIEPVLNTRMKNLSTNFSFRHREREADQVVKQKSHSCSARRLWSSSLYVGLATLSFIFVMFLLFNRPDSYQAFYETVYLSDREPTAKPKVGICLSMPFSARKLQELRIPPQLASFLLYSLSPFYPNQQILENEELLSELTTQYRALVSRMSRRGNLNPLALSRKGPTTKRALRKLLRSLAPKCSEVISGCQIGTKQIVRGEDCCRNVFNKFEYTLQGLCLVAMDFSAVAAESDFPITNPLTSPARLTVILNSTAASGVAIDHRIVPWDAGESSSGGLTVAVVSESSEFSYRNARRDVRLVSGNTVSVNVRKRGVDNTSPSTPLFGSCANDAEHSNELFGAVAQARAGCRSSVIQMIAERSVNCSLLSLPPSDSDSGRKLPVCGPLEGLALMYVLREQGTLVAYQPELLNRFEAGIAERCPSECYFQYFEPEISKLPSDGAAEKLFNVRDSREISIVDVRYRGDDFIRVRRFKSGTFQLLHRLGSVCGCGLALLLLAVLAKKLFAKRKGAKMLFKRRERSYSSVNV